MKKPIIAIDGTAASGKSTTAQRVAQHFKYRYVDTGAMYRAVTLKALRENIDPRDTSALSKLVDTVDIQFKPVNGSVRILLDQTDVTEQIRSPEVTQYVSAVSEVQHVRETLVAEQRKLGQGGGVVVEGRDIGTVVFPDADVKIYMVATSQERARRRREEWGEDGRGVKSEEMERSILQRDHWDSSRLHGPLQKAINAQVLDTTNLTIDEQIDVVIQKVERFLRECDKGDLS